jgi:hypothetical protein
MQADLQGRQRQSSGAAARSQPCHGSKAANVTGQKTAKVMVIGSSSTSFSRSSLSRLMRVSSRIFHSSNASSASACHPPSPRTNYSREIDYRNDINGDGHFAATVVLHDTSSSVMIAPAKAPLYLRVD